MKRLLLMLVVWSGCACATTYYVSSSAGNDNNNGTSAAAPWRTFGGSGNHVNSGTFAPGDVILLARGDVWTEPLVPPSSGTSGNPITFDAYGSGPAPEITGKRDLTGWTQYSTNVWSAPLTASGLSYVMFNTVWGQKQTAMGSLLHDRDFMLNNNAVYVYAPSNPASYYGTVSAIVPLNAPSSDQAIYVNGKSWLVFQHIKLDWFDQFGVNVAGASDHLVFANMESDGMVPAGPMPHGFYVNAATPADIQFINVEVRWSDTGFGPANDRNLVGRFTARTFTVPRLARGQDYFLRQYDNSLPARYSRYSTALHLDYPLT